MKNKRLSLADIAARLKRNAIFWQRALRNVDPVDPERNPLLQDYKKREPKQARNDLALKENNDAPQEKEAELLFCTQQKELDPFICRFSMGQPAHLFTAMGVGVQLQTPLKQVVVTEEDESTNIDVKKSKRK